MAAFLARVAGGERNFSQDELFAAMREANNAYRANNLNTTIDIISAVAVVTLASNVRLDDLVGRLQNENRDLQGRVQRFENNNNIDPQVVARLQITVRELLADKARLQERVRQLELKENLAAIERLRSEARTTELKNIAKLGGTTLGVGGGLLVASAASGPFAPVIFFGGMAVISLGGVGAVIGEAEDKARMNKLNQVESLVRQGQTLAAARQRVGV